MFKKIINKAVFYAYDAGWSLAIPFLKKNSRISDGFTQRTVSNDHFNKADIWIQAASGGEAFLALEILKQRVFGSKKILLTSNTRQGVDILQRAELLFPDLTDQLQISFSPFDRPSIMKKAIAKINPEVMVLIELEMWPGLLKTLKDHRTRTIIINGRLTRNSLNGYLKWPSLWEEIAPDQILAISEADAERFRALFENTAVKVMNNIKFDRLALPQEHFSPSEDNPLKKLGERKKKRVVLGSVRQEEEEAVGYIIKGLKKNAPDTDIWLFPRHMHRVDTWKEKCAEFNLNWQLRSETDTSSKTGDIIIWDIFGELGYAYQLADAAFVGGSLAPLGGQNFLEVLETGLVPVTGPYWDNFLWTGDAIVEQGLLNKEKDYEKVLERLCCQIEDKEPREAVLKRLSDYLAARRGGTAFACSEINRLI